MKQREKGFDVFRTSGFRWKEKSGEVHQWFRLGANLVDRWPLLAKREAWVKITAIPRMRRLRVLTHRMEDCGITRELKLPRGTYHEGVFERARGIPADKNN